MSEQVVIPAEYGIDERSQRPVAFRSVMVVGDCIQLLVAGLLLERLLFQGTEVSATWRLTAIALLLICVTKSYGWAVLVAIQISLFLREPGRDGMTFDFSSSVYCLMAVVLIVYACGARAVHQRVSHWFASQVLSIWERGHGDQRPTADWWRASVLLVSRGLVVGGSLVFAALLLTYLPVSESARTKWLQDAVANGTFWPGATLVVVSLCLLVACREAAWRQMTCAQAQLYQRSVLLLEHHRDLRMVILRRLKVRRKRAANAVSNQGGRP